MKESKIIRLRNVIAYGLGDLYGGGSFFIIGTLFMFFLTDVVGLSPIKAGGVFVIGKIWDAVVDPLLGYLSDRTRSRFGRRRLFFLIGMLPVGITFAMLWMPMHFLNENFTFIYYTFAYILFCTVFSMMMIPYSALNADMTADYKERTRLSGARMIFSQISALLAGVLPNLIIGRFADQGTGYLVMGIAFGVFYTIPWLFVYFGTWEMEVQSENKVSDAMELWTNFLTMFSNKSFRYHMGLYLCAYGAMDVMMALFAFYLTYHLQRPGIYSICLGAMVLTQILCLPFYVKMSNRVGSGKTYILGVSIWAVAMLLTSFLTTTTPLVWVVLNCMLIGAGLAAGVMIPWAILPSVIDVDEMITAKRRAGLYSGMMAFIRQISQAIVGFGIGVALTGIGYVANAEQSVVTLARLKMMFIFTPVVLIVFGIVLAARFRITPRTHKVLIDELERLRSGGEREQVAVDVKAICEEMTGIEYTELYRAG